jgi:putative transcriptional regulator
MMASDAFEDIKAGLLEAIEYAQGNTKGSRTHKIEVPEVDVAAARLKLGLSQGKFANIFRISASTLRKWEQGQRHPTGPALVLLNVIDREPEAVLRTLRGLGQGGRETTR